MCGGVHYLGLPHGVIFRRQTCGGRRQCALGPPCRRRGGKEGAVSYRPAVAPVAEYVPALEPDDSVSAVDIAADDHDAEIMAALKDGADQGFSQKAGDVAGLSRGRGGVRVEAVRPFADVPAVVPAVQDN